MQKQYTLTIKAPIEKSFATATEKPSMEHWMQGDIFTHFKTLRDSDSPVGTKFKHIIRGFFDIEGEVIAYQNPLVFGIGLQAGPLKGTIMYRFEELENTETKLTCDLEILDGTKARRIASKTFFPIIHKLITKHLESLKQLAEEQQDG